MELFLEVTGEGHFQFVAHIVNANPKTEQRIKSE